MKKNGENTGSERTRPAPGDVGRQKKKRIYYLYINNTDFQEGTAWMSKTALLRILNDYRDWNRRTWGNLYCETIIGTDGKEYKQTGKNRLEMIE